jgi:VanZ family protein
LLLANHLVMSRRIFFLAGLAYLLFVIYGSLVPFDFHPRPLVFALREFLHIRYLHLGMDSRADWVANLLLYIPLPFLWLGAVSRQGRSVLAAFFSLMICLLCVALAIGIEFAQQFFPPRTVSLNDILAEIAGTILGIVLWWAAGDKVGRLLESLVAQGKSAAYAGLTLYTIGYLAFSLFPYDFLISANEIRAKFASGFLHWLPSRAACGGTLRCSAKLVAEAAAIVPLGLLFGVVSRKSKGQLVWSAAWIGGWLGLIIETLQFFLVSGITLAASVLTRVIGVAAGAAAGEGLKRTSLWPLLYLLRPFMPLAGAVYVILLAGVTWLGKGPIVGLEEGIKRLNEIRFMPFYYHYYTSESAAITSLFAVAIMFVPLGIQYWVLRVTTMREFVLRGVINAAFMGAVISAVIELGKLFLRSARPDPTNVLIGSMSVAIGFIAASLSTKATLNLGAMDGDPAAHASS